MPMLLITGRPGSGKTTLVRDTVETLGQPAAGFYTRETRGPDGRRTGFEIVTLDGETATLAHVDFAGTGRVGRYGVDVSALERVGVPAIDAAATSGRLAVIDEIGKMELLLPAFQRAVIDLVRLHRPLLATIMGAPHPFADELKAQPDVLLFELTESNREELRGLVEAHVRGMFGELSV